MIFMKMNVIRKLNPRSSSSTQELYQHRAVGDKFLKLGMMTLILKQALILLLLLLKI